MRLLIIFICVILNFCNVAQPFLLSAGSTVLNFVIFKGLQKAFPDTNQMIQQRKLTDIQHGLENVIHHIDDLETEIRDSFRKIEGHLNVQSLFNAYEGQKIAIISKCKLIFLYGDHHDKLNNLTFIEVAKDALGLGTDSLPLLLQEFHESVFGISNRLVNFMVNQILTENNIGNQTVHDRIKTLFFGLMSIEVQGYLARQVALSLLKNQNIGDFTAEQNIFLQQSDQRIQMMKEIFAPILHQADRSIWQLDPAKHKRGVTHDEITRFHQNFVLNEHAFDTCTGTCGDYRDPVYNFDSQGYQLKQQTCNGFVYGCYYIGKEHVYFSRQLCLSKPESMRRYENYREVQTKQYGQVWGINTTNCWDILRPVDFTKGFVSCDVCICVCDEPKSSKTQRTFYLSSQMTDVANNYIVTGVRFEMYQRSFYLRIQQSQLTTGGTVNTSSTTWLPRPEMNNNNLYTVNLKTRIALGDIELSSSIDNISVITGLKFIQQGDDLIFQTQYSKLNFSDGTLLGSSSKWQNLDCGKCETIQMPESGIPTAFKNNKPNGRKGYYKFIRSNKYSDFGQSTTPFIDTRSVSSELSAVTGIGFHLRAASESGGFIAPKLTIMDYATIM